MLKGAVEEKVLLCYFLILLNFKIQTQSICNQMEQIAVLQYFNKHHDAIAEANKGTSSSFICLFGLFYYFSGNRFNRFRKRPFEYAPEFQRHSRRADFLPDEIHGSTVGKSATNSGTKLIGNLMILLILTLG